MQPKTILPSPYGPFWCWQTFETAEILPSYLKIATLSPERQTMRVTFFGRLFRASGPTSEKQRQERHRAGNDE